jgi:transposase-like protein
MGRRVFPREFKVEAVRLIHERGVSVAQAARDLEIHENMLWRWAKERSADPMQALGSAMASSCLAGVMALRGVGSLALRLPRLASSRAKRSRDSGRRAKRKDPLELRGERSHLWRTPRLAGRACGRPLLRSAQGRAPDADDRPARSPATSAASKRHRRKIAVRRAQPSRSAIRR